MLLNLTEGVLTENNLATILEMREITLQDVLSLVVLGPIFLGMWLILDMKEFSTKRILGVLLVIVCGVLLALFLFI